jgi:hypothetical protein
MGKKYLISEKQFRLINEDLDPLRAVIALMGVAISVGGIWGLSEILERISRRAQAGGHRERISTRNEKEILLSAFNLAKGRVDTEISKLKNIKVKFDTFCPYQSGQVGTTNFEIKHASYIIDAQPKNHLSSYILFMGTNLDTGKQQSIILKSLGDDVIFQSMDENAETNFGCSTKMVNLFNKKLYKHCVQDLKLSILDFPIHYTSNVKTDF